MNQALRILKSSEIQQLLTFPAVIQAAQRVYVQKSQQSAVAWPMVFYEFEPGQADMDIKSGYLQKEETFGLKLVSWYANNQNQKLPALYGTMLVCDSNTGQPIGVLDAVHITGMRTGAAGAIGAKYLARPNAKHLLLVGTGHQGLYQLAASLTALEGIETIGVCNPNHPDKAISFCNDINKRLADMLLPSFEKGSKAYQEIEKKLSITIMPVLDIESAVKQSDIIITATSARRPFIQASWVKPGTHISCIGADMPGKQEIDEALFPKALVFVDDIEQALKNGESEIPLKKGVFHKSQIAAEIGQVISGEKVGRKNDQEITIFDSTGLALHDLICAKMVLDIAEKQELGLAVDLYE